VTFRCIMHWIVKLLCCMIADIDDYPLYYAVDSQIDLLHNAAESHEFLLQNEEDSHEFPLQYAVDSPKIYFGVKLPTALCSGKSTVKHTALCSRQSNP
jgi:hypothetical protein